MSLSLENYDPDMWNVDKRVSNKQLIWLICLYMVLKTINSTLIKDSSLLSGVNEFSKKLIVIKLLKEVNKN